MCNTLTLAYQCGHHIPAKGIALCDTALYDNNVPCAHPQRKKSSEPGVCADCTISSVQARIEQTRQNCIRLGASPAQMARLKPTSEQVRDFGERRRYQEDWNDGDSGYGSAAGSVYSGGGSVYSGISRSTISASTTSSSRYGGGGGSYYSSGGGGGSSKSSSSERSWR